MAKSRAVLQPIFVGMRRSEVVFVGQSRPSDVIFVGQARPASRPKAERVQSPVPVDDTDFIRLYEGTIRKQVAGFVGIDPNEVEDISQTIMLQFIEGDYLKIYSAVKQSKFVKSGIRSIWPNSKQVW